MRIIRSPSVRETASSDTWNQSLQNEIKIWWACDSSTSCLLVGKIYLGRQPGTELEVNQGALVVKSLTKNWLRSERNVVTDNFFKSVELAVRRSHYTCQQYSQEQTRHTKEVDKERQRITYHIINTASNNCNFTLKMNNRKQKVTQGHNGNRSFGSYDQNVEQDKNYVKNFFQF